MERFLSELGKRRRSFGKIIDGSAGSSSGVWPQLACLHGLGSWALFFASSSARSLSGIPLVLSSHFDEVG